MTFEEHHTEKNCADEHNLGCTGDNIHFRNGKTCREMFAAGESLPKRTPPEEGARPELSGAVVRKDAHPSVPSLDREHPIDRHATDEAEA